MTPSTLRARAAAFFVEPRTPPADVADLVPLVRRDPPGDLADLVPLVRNDPPFAPPHAAPVWPPPLAAPRPAAPSPPIGSCARAAVLGRPAQAVPSAAALACSLRVAHRAPAAVVATWTPGARAPVPRGPGAPGASRFAARLSARGLAATAHGILVWLPLSDHVVAASVAVRRASAALDVPLVVALAGPRCDVVEALLREQDLVIVVAEDPGSPLARLAVGGCSVPATARTPAHGARRVLAMAGLAR